MLDYLDKRRRLIDAVQKPFNGLVNFVNKRILKKGKYDMQGSRDSLLLIDDQNHSRNNRKSRKSRNSHNIPPTELVSYSETLTLDPNPSDAGIVNRGFVADDLPLDRTHPLTVHRAGSDASATFSHSTMSVWQLDFPEENSSTSGLTRPPSAVAPETSALMPTDPETDDLLQADGLTQADDLIQADDLMPTEPTSSSINPPEEVLQPIDFSSTENLTFNRRIAKRKLSEENDSKELKRRKIKHNTGVKKRRKLDHKTRKLRGGHRGKSAYFIRLFRRAEERKTPWIASVMFQS